MELYAKVRVPLRDFELDVELNTRADVLGIFGRSGAGKTSLVESLCGLRQPARGSSMSLDGQVWMSPSDRRAVPAHARAVGYVPQGSLLFPDRNVLRNLRAGASRQRLGAAEGAELEARVIEALELNALLHAMPAELSGGEQQRVALGRALCSGARLLVLDEPTASLGVVFRRKALALLDRIRRQFNVPMVVVSHEPLDLQFLCDEMVVLERGRIVAHGPPASVLPRVLEPERRPPTLLRGMIVSVDSHLTIVELAGLHRITVSGAAGTVGDSVVVGVDAARVVLARKQPEEVSALNSLPCLVQNVEHAGSHLSLELRLQGSDIGLRSEITEAARARLGLRVGMPVFAVIKSVTVWATPS